MNLEEFKQTIKELFGADLLKDRSEYGFTNTTNKEIKKIGYATNLSMESVEQAVQNDVDFILTHHDAWDFLYGLREACVKKLQEHKISHFWIHAPLDYVEFGTSTSLMKALDIDEINNYSSADEKGGELPGIGEFNDAIDFGQLTDKMRLKLSESVRAWKNNEGKVKRIGVLTGAGHSTEVIRKAVEAGCDTYITGETSLYTIQYAEFVGINLLVGSHTFTEIFGVETLAKKVIERHPDVELMELEESHFELNQTRMDD